MVLGDGYGAKCRELFFNAFRLHNKEACSDSSHHLVRVQ